MEPLVQKYTSKISLQLTNSLSINHNSCDSTPSSQDDKSVETKLMLLVNKNQSYNGSPSRDNAYV